PASTSKEEIVQIINPMGQIIYSTEFSFSNKELTIDTQNFTSGIYLVRLGNLVKPLTIE
ncbi:MAG: T9SS type A sorting domain-containing protein, partial [Cytophagales bacterium]|nr:T9SS type A sorting domain-containing protein [Cytophagales bacterium]